MLLLLTLYKTFYVGKYLFKTSNKYNRQTFYTSFSSAFIVDFE